MPQWPGLFVIWESPSDPITEAIAAQFDQIMYHPQTGQHTRPVKNLNPTSIAGMYTMLHSPVVQSDPSQLSQPWLNDLHNVAAANWYLQSPDGSGNRCKWTVNPGIADGNVIDPRTAAINNYLAAAAVNYLKATWPTAWTGVNGLLSWANGDMDWCFDDGAFINSYLARFTGAYSANTPTVAEEQGWSGSAAGGTDPAWILSMVQAVNAALISAGLRGLVRNSVWDTRYSYGGIDESFNDPYVYGVCNEFHFRGSDQRDYTWQIQRMQKAVRNGTRYFGLVGADAAAGGTGLYTGLTSASIGSMLLATDGSLIFYGPYAYSSGQLTYAQSVRASIQGPNINDGHGGNVFSPDGSAVFDSGLLITGGLLQRNLLRNGSGPDVVVLLNTDPNGVTRGGLAPGTGTIDGSFSGPGF